MSLPKGLFGVFIFSRRVFFGGEGGGGGGAWENINFIND